MSKQSKTNLLEKYSELNDSPAELWAVSYGDLMTILLVFFVLLTSATHVSAIKFEQIKRAFQGATDEEGLAIVLESLEREISENNLEKTVDIQADGNSVQITFHDSLLFDLGKSEVRDEGLKVIEKFSTSLQKLPAYARLAIEGYTDDNPVNTSVYESNWHLSALRSLSVLKVLEKNGACGENCEIRGFGANKAAVPNRDEKGHPIAKNQSENRRVVLRIY